MDWILGVGPAAPLPPLDLGKAAPQVRVHYGVESLPGYKAPTSVPALASLVSLTELKKRKREMRMVYPDVNFSKEAIKGRKTFLLRVDRQLAELTERYERQRREWELRKADSVKLALFGENMTRIRQEIRMNKSVLGPQANAEDSPSDDEPTVQRAKDSHSPKRGGFGKFPPPKEYYRKFAADEPYEEPSAPKRGGFGKLPPPKEYYKKFAADEPYEEPYEKRGGFGKIPTKVYEQQYGHDEEEVDEEDFQPRKKLRKQSCKPSSTSTRKPDTDGDSSGDQVMQEVNLA